MDSAEILDTEEEQFECSCDPHIAFVLLYPVLKVQRDLLQYLQTVL
jgi:hypothetical protein